MKQEQDKETLLNSLGYALLAFLLQGVVLLFPIALTLWMVLLTSLAGCGSHRSFNPKEPVQLTDLNDSTQVAKVLYRLHVGSETNIIINSPGGPVDVYEAIALAAIEAKSRGHVVRCTVDGVANSAAFLIFTVCSERFATSKSRVLWHPAGVTVGGGIRYTRAMLRAGICPDDWTDEDLQDAITRMDNYYTEHLTYLQSVLPMDPAIVKTSYDREWSWSVKLLHNKAPGFLTLIEENE